jgi:hypothetical protein
LPIAEYRAEIKPCASDDAPADSLLSEQPIPERGDEVLDWFNSEFWPLYPRKVAKPKALQAVRRHGKTPERRAEITAGLRSQLAWLATQLRADGDFRPYPATWINTMRWQDCPSENSGTASRDAVSFGIAGAMRLLKGEE